MMDITARDVDERDDGYTCGDCDCHDVLMPTMMMLLRMMAKIVMLLMLELT